MHMRTKEIEAIGELAGEALAAGGTLIKETHEGIAGRAFGAVGPMGAPVRAVHDRVTGSVYSGVSRALRAAGESAGRAAAKNARSDGPSLASTPGGAFGLAVLNGFYGDRLTAARSELAIDMAIRDPSAAETTPRLAVFVHGLCETDEAWLGFPPVRSRATYGERLQRDLGLTPLHVRYNTGLHVSENGAQLARSLEELVAGWPLEVQDLVLVGHSMGGLVARSACHYGEAEQHRWTDVVRHVFCLGTPHLGADLEKGANALAWALGRLPETRALSKLINARSTGIKDLRFGSCVEEDWCDCDVDEFMRDRCNEVPFLPDANYYFIGSTLTPEPVGRLLGDLLVRMPSASGRGNGRGRRIPFEVDKGYELSGLTHFDLLNHDAVYEQIKKWIGGAGSHATRPAAAHAPPLGVVHAPPRLQTHPDG